MKHTRLSPSTHLSPWPPQVRACIIRTVTSFIILIKTSIYTLPIISVLSLLICLRFWWQDISWEFNRGEHSLQTLDNIKLSLILFILREVILFISLLWRWFHFSLSPPVLGGHSWPPVGVLVINPKGVPLLRTLLLVRRGISITWGHHLLIVGNKTERVVALSYTISLGIILFLNQIIEFKNTLYTIRDGVYSSVLLILTGFHGIHVILGLVFLRVGELHLINNCLTNTRHTSIDLLVWYWHLVDCIWLVVYAILYWWRN